MGMTVISLLIAALAFAASWLVHVFGSYYPANAKLEAVGLIFLLSPVLALPTALAVAPAFLVFLKSGRAGWCVAIASAALAGMIALFALSDFDWSSDVFTLGGGLGCVFGALFWLSGKIFHPEVFGGATQ